MKKIITLLCFFCTISFSSVSQNNIVDNGGFEFAYSGASCDRSGGLNYFDVVNNYWNFIPPWTVPEKAICQTNEVGTSDCLCDGGHTGIRYGYTGYHEYIVAPLNTAMEIGKVYYVEFWVQGSVARSNSGVKFFEDRPKQCSTNQLSDNGNANVGIFGAVSFSYWTKMSYYFTADRAYDWIGLGSFNTGNHTEVGPTFTFDDIKVIKVGSSFCPDVNYIQNTYFQDIGLITYRSQNLTISGRNIASTIPIGNVVVGSNALVEYKSETLVILEDGFSTDDGAYFVAKIAPCGSECFPPTASAGNDNVSCNNQTLQLGGSGDFGNTYSWSASPSSGLSYLSNSNISNPNFVPPSTGFGTVIFTLTVSNECGETASDEIVISYDANPSNSPSVSVSNVVYSDLIEFDVSCAPQTEEVIIDVLTASGTLLNTYNYFVGIDFTCCSFHWQIPNGITPCRDYQIRIRSRNICSTDLSVPIIILNWVRNRVPSFTLVPNVFTPNSDGVNDSWCFDFSGAIQYQIEIFNPSGVRVYSNSSSSILPPTACVWSGECNQTACTSTFVTDGTYFYVLTITGCDGSTATTNGFISVMFGRSLTSTDTTQTQNYQEQTTQVVNSQTEALIYPNPNDGTFIIQNYLEEKNSILIISDFASKVVFTKTMTNNQLEEINLQQLESGIYLVQINNKNSSSFSKIIIIK